MPDPHSSTSDAPYETALLDAPVRVPKRILLRARARLYADRVEVTGWQLRGRYRHQISLREILEVEIARPGDLLLCPHDEACYHLFVDDADRWKTAIEAHRACLPPKRT